ncbi:MAG: phosphatase PAP2 family protein [Boseongicola sp.]
MAYQADIADRSTAARVLSQLTAPFTIIVVAHGLLSVILAYATGYRFDPGMAGLLAMILGLLVPWFLLVLLIRRTVLLAIVDRSERPVADMVNIMKSLFADRDRMLGGSFQLLLVSFFVGSFGYQKELVAVVQPFGWDVAFAEIDRFVHFGLDPFRLLLPVFGSPLATSALNAVYHAWFFLIYFVVFVACFAQRGHKPSIAFLIALVLTFAIGGNAMAIMFSSAGPVYFERLGLGGDFVPLMSHLNSVAEISPVWALQVQEDLWAGYMNDGVLAGISAMPSMHVATAVLMALYAWTHARWAGYMMALFAILIMLGSVHLGWHYAVDGYVGAMIAWIAWRIGLAVARREGSA